VATQLSTSQPYSPVYAEIAVRVRELAVRQGLETGDRLPAERELARLLGVSRTSLREALTALRVDGEIEVRRGDGIYLLRTPGESVPPIPATLREQHPGLPALGEVRNALEALAAELAAVRRTDADLVGMVEAIRTMDAAVAGGEDPVEGDRMFHAAILQAAHNPALAALLEQISEGALRIAAASLTGRAQADPRCDRGPRFRAGLAPDAQTSGAHGRDRTTSRRRLKGARPGGAVSSLV
jgi:GntR family transcriptional repressor for pyruvate dehydrogenase complex